jgi:hypothetical protein
VRGPFSNLHTPPKIPAPVSQYKHTSLTFLEDESSELRFSLAQIALLVTPFVTL